MIVFGFLILGTNVQFSTVAVEPLNLDLLAMFMPNDLAFDDNISYKM